MSAQTSMLPVRVDEQLKARASAALAGVGLTLSDAVRILLTRVAAEGGLPAGLTADPAAHYAWFRAKVLATPAAATAPTSTGKPRQCFRSERRGGPETNTVGRQRRGTRRCATVNRFCALGTARTVRVARQQRRKGASRLRHKFCNTAQQSDP